MMINLSNAYLKTPMARWEYMHLKITDIHKEIIKQYKLRDIVTPDKYVYCKINKEMYSLPQSGIIAQQLIVLGKWPYLHCRALHARERKEQGIWISNN